MPDPASHDRDHDRDRDRDFEAWLAGELDPEERQAFEAALERPDDEAVSEEGATVLLADLDRKRTEPDAPLNNLIALLKTQPGADLPAPGRDTWRDILTPTDDPDLLGTLGDYEVLEVIATGGMGIVFKARDPKLHRIAAVKALSPALAANRTARERFLQEARAAARLEHENILPIHGVHEADGIPYFAMRHAAGGSLQDALDRGEQFEIEKLKSLAAQVASALGAAHDKGIIHRDVKPGNILFDADGEKVWVCDFGIARSTEYPALTYAGTVAGTPQFMSPEQADGLELDGRSDLFSLGAVLYRCATGRHAFEGVTTTSVLKNIGTAKFRSATQFNDSLPSWFDGLIRQLLAKDPAQRPANAEALVRSLREHRATTSGRVIRPKRLLTVVLLVLAIGIAAFQLPSLRNALTGKKNPSRTSSAPAPKPSTDPLIVIAETGARFTDFRAAAEAAPPGATLILSGRIPCDQVQTPPAKRLNLQSAPGTTAVVVASHPQRRGILFGGPGTVRGIRFERFDSAEGAFPVFAINGRMEEVLIEDCEFVSRGSGPDVPFHRALGISDSPKATVRRCVMRAPGGSACLVGTRGDFVFEDCLFIGKAALERRNMTEPRPPGQLLAERCIVFADYLLHRAPSQRFDALHLDLRHCLLDVKSRLFELRDINAGDLPELISWHGEGNIHRPGATVLRTFRERADVGFTAVSAPDFAALEALGVLVQDENPVHREIFDPDRLSPPITPVALLGAARNTVDSPAIATLANLASPSTGEAERFGAVIKETGQSFTDLASAIIAAPENSTLLLRGRHVCGPLLTPPRVLNFAAAPGASPVLVARSPKDHILFLYRPGTVRGIRFVRENSAEGALPLLGIGGGRNQVLIEDCEFVSLPGEGSPGNHRALSITDCGRALIRRCSILAPRGNSFIVAFKHRKPNIGSDSTIEFEDCLFTGDSAVEQRSFSAIAQPASLQLRRCVLHTSHFLVHNDRFFYEPLHLAVFDSLLDIRSDLIRFPQQTRPGTPPVLSWRSENVIVSRELQAEFATIGERGVKSANQNLRTRTIFTGAKLSQTPTAAELLESLDPALDAPAVDTLRQLAAQRRDRTTPATQHP